MNFNWTFEKYIFWTPFACSGYNKMYERIFFLINILSILELHVNNFVSHVSLFNTRITFSMSYHLGIYGKLYLVIYFAIIFLFNGLNQIILLLASTCIITTFIDNIPKVKQSNWPFVFILFFLILISRHLPTFVFRGEDHNAKWYKFDDGDVSECKMDDEEVCV
jgi:hypothetical protein